MGKGDQIIGYRYRAGLQLVCSITGIDAIIKIRMQDKIIWEGEKSSGQIEVNKLEIFGGEGKEGGVSGFIDVLPGDAAQVQNDYMQRVLEDDNISAWRGVFSLVFRNFYVTNNPFLKPISAQLRAIYQTFENWVPAKAPINPEYCVDGDYIYIALDNSFSMYPTDAPILKGAVVNFLDSLRGSSATIKLVAFSKVIDSDIEVIASTDEDYDTLIAWVEALVQSSDSLVDIAPDMASATIYSNATGDTPPLNVGFATFDPDNFNPTNLANITTSPLFGDAFPNNNSTGPAFMYYDIDISGFAVGQTINYDDTIVVQSAGLTATFNNNITVFYYTAAEAADPTAYGASSALVNNGAAGAPPRTISRSYTFSKTRDTETVARIYTQVPNAWYVNGSNYRYARISQPTITVLEDLADWEEAVSLSPEFFFTSPSADSVRIGSILGSLLEGGDGDASRDDTPINKSMIFVSSGDPRLAASRPAAEVILDTIENLNVFAYNINNASSTDSDAIDNTATDGVPNITSAESDQIAITEGDGRLCAVDINPAHILRDMVVNSKWGGAGDSSVIGDTFEAVANVLFDEGLGVSFLEGGRSKLEFKREIEEHMDGVMFEDPGTGKWELKLIRDDYTKGDLFAFDQSQIVEWFGPSRPRQQELPNQVTVKFTKRANGADDSVTVHNIAAIQQTGYINPKVQPYRGITWGPLAARIAMRDLAALTVPLWSGSIRVKYLPSGYNLGSAFVINDSRVGMNSVVCRIQDINYGDGKDNSVTIKFIEDKFSFPASALVTTETQMLPNLVALPPQARWVVEMPYWAAARRLGDTEIISRLNEDPDSGAIAATGSRPNAQHLDMAVSVAVGTTYETTVAVANFAPYAVLSEAISKDPTATTLTMPLDYSLYRVAPGSLLVVGEEIMRVASMTDDEGIVSVVVGRGCLDTVPAAHDAGAAVLFWSNAIARPIAEFTAGETQSIKLLTRTSSSTLKPSQATADSITFDSRAIRPYPAGNFKINDSYVDGGDFVADSVFTWTDRDRTLQTSANPEIFIDGDVGPEAGTSYLFRIEAFGGGESLGVYSETDLGTAKTHTVTDIDDAPSSASYVEFYVVPERDGYEAWQSYRYRRFTDRGLVTESGERLTAEDSTYMLKED